MERIAWSVITKSAIYRNTYAVPEPTSAKGLHEEGVLCAKLKCEVMAIRSSRDETRYGHEPVDNLLGVDIEHTLQLKLSGELAALSINSAHRRQRPSKCGGKQT